MRVLERCTQTSAASQCAWLPSATVSRSSVGVVGVSSSSSTTRPHGGFARGPPMSRSLANRLTSRRFERETAPSRAVLLVAASPLYLIATGRWGSYVHAPGLPLFAGDILLLVSLIAVTVHDTTSPTRR